MGRSHGIRVLAVVTTLLLGSAISPAHEVGPDAQEWERVVSRAIAYLRTSQAEDGSWSKEKSPGITGVVLTGILSTGKVGLDDPMVVRALKYIESLINEKEGHIAGQDSRVQLQNYITCINVMALKLANREDKYKKIIGDATAFLKRLQWDEGEGKLPADDFYGGAGYDSKSRPDLSNSQMFLEALHAAGLPKDDPAFRRALVFVGRCQNLKGEFNDQAWAGIINDGSFIYSAAAGGQTKVRDEPTANGGLPGYGSMTYAGIKSMIYCGVAPNDPRIKKAYEWITRNYTVDANPGMPQARLQWGLFYYYHTMAKTLSTLGIDVVVDGHGTKHDWRADLTQALAKRQRPDGSWINDNHWLEADPNLISGYALMALSHCQKKK